MARFGFIAALLALSGCYDSYLLGSRDASPAEDSSADVSSDTLDTDGGTDASGDAELDAPEDAPFDAEEDAAEDVGPDAEEDADVGPPPPPSPPNPETCRIEPEIFPFDNPELEYRWPTEGLHDFTHRDSVHVCAVPLAIDLEPSGADLEPDLVFVSYPTLGRAGGAGILRIVDPRTHETISFPAADEDFGVLEASTNVAAGDLDGDGRNEIVGIGESSGSYAFRSDGTLMWRSDYPRRSDRGMEVGRFATIGGSPFLADLEGDGDVEVIFGRNVIDGVTGELIWDGDDELGNATNRFLGPLPCVADLDGDGDQEIVSGNTLFSHTGEVLWQIDSPDGVCAIADMIPATEGPEVILVSNGFVRILAAEDGEELWIRRLEGRGSQNIGGAPTVADFDGDRRPELGIAHAASYAVYDLDCVTGMESGCVGEGVRWLSPTQDGSSAGTGSSVFDFNGDGRAEVIYNDEVFFRIYDGVDGTTLFQWANSSRTRSENPAIVDIDNDGDAEIVFSANAEGRFIEEFWTDPGVEIWGDARGRWVGARRIWNQHAYDIHNIEEDGSIPARPERTFDSYRQNLREGGDVLVVPDLWGGQGNYVCNDDGSVTLSVNVRNFGLERAGITVVGFYEGDPALGNRVGEASTTRPLLPRGDGEVVSVTIPRGPEEPTDYYAELDDPLEPAGGSIFECRESNNRSLIWSVRPCE